MNIYCSIKNNIWYELELNLRILERELLPKEE